MRADLRLPASVGIATAQGGARANLAILGVTLVGFVAAAVTLSANRSAMVGLGYGWRFSEEQVVRPPLYYAAHATQIAALALAGSVAVLSTARAVAPRVRVTFWAMQLAGALMAFRGLDLQDFFTTRFFASTGMVVTLMSGLAFLSIRKANFEVLDRVLVALAVVACGAVFYAVATLPSLAREEVTRSLQPFLNTLYWVAVWLVIRPQGPRGPLRILAWLPLVVYAAGSVLTQTRLNLVMLALALIAQVYVNARRTGKYVSALGGVLMALLLAATGALVVADSPIATMLGEAFTGMRDRLGDDTRTGQLVSFLEDVAPWELILGRGTRATWNWPGMSATWPGGTDVGYLSLLFFGGLPLLVTYVLFHIVPAWRVVRSPGAPVALGPAVMVLLWSARMFSSSFPALSLEYYPVLLFVGVCLRENSRGPGSVPRGGRGVSQPG